MKTERILESIKGIEKSRSVGELREEVRRLNERFKESENEEVRKYICKVRMSD